MLGSTKISVDKVYARTRTQLNRLAGITFGGNATLIIHSINFRKRTDGSAFTFFSKFSFPKTCIQRKKKIMKLMGGRGDLYAPFTELVKFGFPLLSFPQFTFESNNFHEHKGNKERIRPQGGS